MNRIRIVMVTNDLNINGISNVVANLSCHLSKDMFDIYVVSGNPIDNYYKELAGKHNFSIIDLPSRKKSTIQYYKKYYKCLKSIKPDIVHIHGNSALVTPEIIISKVCGISNIIMHCHSSRCNHKRLHNIFYPIFIRNISMRLACSAMAGEWIFGENNFTILPNGFETSRFVYDPKKRTQLRKKIGEDKFIIGHIGRFNTPKNHEFILDIFDEYAKLNENAILVLVGNGPDFEEIKTKVDNHMYSNRIILYGETEDTSSLYSAFDVFIFPSKYEGLGLVAVEAQISGLPCIVSTNVPRDVIVSNDIFFEELKSVDAWKKRLNEIYSRKKVDRELLYKENFELINHYDINEAVNRLQNIYLKMMCTK